MGNDSYGYDPIGSRKQSAIGNGQTAVTNYYAWGLDLSGGLQGAGGVGGLAADMEKPRPFKLLWSNSGNQYNCQDWATEVEMNLEDLPLFPV